MSNNQNIVDQVAKHANLPGTGLEKKLEKLIQAAGYSKNSITLEQLRKVLMNYLQDTFFDYPAA